jgi:hypothetical protein
MGKSITFTRGLFEGGRGSGNNGFLLPLFSFAGGNEVSMNSQGSVVA